MLHKLNILVLAILQKGLTWQETIVASLALAAIVLMTLIITIGMTKTLICFANAFRDFLSPK